MHEIGIANSILDSVTQEVSLRPDSVPRKVAVRIGELTAVDPDALRFAFEALTRDTELESLALAIEMCTRRHLCTRCNVEFAVIDFDSSCPQCRHEATKCISGEQLEIAYIEMETYESSTA
jgi:hydrogenase nickel incorporation protein HypA/HybF